MFKCLNTGMIGIEVAPLEAVELAAKFGFKGVDLNIAQVDDAAKVRDALQRHGLQAGSAGGLVPGKSSVPDDEWNAGMDKLDALARKARDAGFSRTTSVVLPFHEELPMQQNVDLHVRRIRQAAPILASYGIRIGLEYVSQKTRRAGYPHPFVYNLKDLLGVISKAGEPNVGILLDSFHWYCAEEDTRAVRSLTNQQVVVVHVNDSIKGRKNEEQIAFERELPCASGDVDLKGFLEALASIGYDGPVTAEPMNKALNAMARDEKLRATSEAMDRMFAL